VNAGNPGHFLENSETSSLTQDWLEHCPRSVRTGQPFQPDRRDRDATGFDLREVRAWSFTISVNSMIDLSTKLTCLPLFCRERAVEFTSRMRAMLANGAKRSAELVAEYEGETTLELGDVSKLFPRGRVQL
jgi:hypothetical protein